MGKYEDYMNFSPPASQTESGIQGCLAVGTFGCRV